MNRVFFAMALILSSTAFSQEDLQACQKNEDCVVVTEKCGHAAINKKYLSEAKKKKSLDLENCVGLVDAKRFHFVGVCSAGQCKAVAEENSGR